MVDPNNTLDIFVPRGPSPIVILDLYLNLEVEGLLLNLLSKIAAGIFKVTLN